ncbi:MAG: Plastocyanin [Frankiales bacterium]|nr:Plastocyanin [Frankiales bacterium]
MLLSPSRVTTVVPLLALVGFGLTGCSSGSTKATGSAPSATTPAAAPTTDAASSTPTATAGASMTISGFAYSPTPLTVAPGTVIPVKNLDGPEHTVTSDTSKLFLADDIAHGKTVTFTAPSKAGTYTFHCEYHANMHGTLIVT